MTDDSVARIIAIYIDLENVAIGVRDARMKSFDIDLVLKRLLDKGNIVVRKAYADWGRYEEYKRALHSAGVVHFLWLVKADLLEPLVYAGVLGVLLGWRLLSRR